jgi:hypothetical protein
MLLVVMKVVNVQNRNRAPVHGTLYRNTIIKHTAAENCAAKPSIVSCASSCMHACIQPSNQYFFPQYPRAEGRYCDIAFFVQGNNS